MTLIAASARIHPDAIIGEGCRIGEFCVIESDVILGARCILEPYVYIKRWTTLGDDNEISAGTVLGTDPLDKGFKGDRSYLRIGHRNKIREHFTISRATHPEGETTIGDGNYIMTSGHIAHDCRIGNDTVICSCALIAGYVEVGERAFISGGVVVHQHSKIGRLAMIGGNTRVNLDAPPFFLYSGFDIAPQGINIVGLRRAAFTTKDVAILKRAYRILYRENLNLEAALTRIEAEIPSPLTQELTTFIKSSKRGICRE